MHLTTYYPLIHSIAGHYPEPRSNKFLVWWASPRAQKNSAKRRTVYGDFARGRRGTEVLIQSKISPYPHYKRSVDLDIHTIGLSVAVYRLLNALFRAFGRICGTALYNHLSCVLSCALAL